MRLLSLFLGATLAAGCGPSGTDDLAECEGEFLPGDLVITEIMANPDGDDSGNEWFEIYNATGMQLDLTGLELVASREDLTGENTHVMPETIVAAGDYLVVGGVLPEFAQEHVDHGYGDELGDLRNGAGRVALQCDVITVDEVIYADMSDGVAQGFDGSRAPDHTANDDRANWCEATTEYAAGNFGSPGMPNEPCSTVVPDTCDDGGTERDVVSPEIGDLVITELMPDPAAVGDTEGEWFEVYAVNPVDLNGLELGSTVGEADTGINDTACLRVGAGDYVLFAHEADAQMNGGLPAVDFTFDFSLTNSGGTIFVGVGDTVLDEVTWSDTPTGASIQLDPGSRDPDANDDESVWCEGTTPYGDGDPEDLGTPGAANDDCPLAVPDGMCLDGQDVRAIDPPAAGEVLITEYMADPDQVSDTDGEWIELHAVGGSFDLNELRIGRTEDGVSFTTSEVIDVPECITVSAGAYPVLAKTDDPAANGGLPAVLTTFGFSLVNTNDGIMIGIDGGDVLDAVTYTGTTTGVAESYDETNMVWCDADTTMPYGDGDFGTPGQMNPLCQ